MRNLHRQQGVTLIMALIMLVVLTLLAVSSFNLGKSNLMVVNNMQQRDESLAAAREVIEEVLSSSRFSESSDETLLNACGQSNARCVDTNGDGTDDIKVTLTPAPQCVKVKVLKTTELDLEDEEQRDCSVGPVNMTGVAGANTGNSMCSDSVWEITAVATDMRTEATTTVTQGISVKVANDDILTECP